MDFENRDLSFLIMNGASSEENISADVKLKQLKQEIQRCKENVADIEKDTAELKRAEVEAKQMTTKFLERSEKLQSSLQEEEHENKRAAFNLQTELEVLDEENHELRKTLENLQTELKTLEAEEVRLQEQTKVSRSVPEQKMVFKGKCQKEKDDSGSNFDVNPRILYPIEGGTALVTFEDADIAQNVLERKEHEVEVGECRIKVQAHPVALPHPTYVEIQTAVCSRRILVSNIPKGLPEEQLLDKLELYFSKTRNGGGEVESRELLPDSGNVVINFCEDGIASSLSSKEQFSVPLGEKGTAYPLRVTPYIMGEIKDLKTTVVVSEKTVLLKGIPDIMDEENLADYLEIHFQKPSNGGGEVDEFLYVPVGKRALAVFEQDTEKKE